MRAKRAFLFGAGLLLAAVGTLILLTNHAANRCPLPLSVNYVGNGQYRNSGTVLSGPTFWLTNHTSKTLAVSLWYVEVQDGENWTRCGFPSRHLTLSPYGGSYTTIEFAYRLYPTNVWRLKGTTSEQLSGGGALLAALRYFPVMLRERYGRGNTNIAFNPIAKGRVWYGGHREIVSQTVLDPKSIR